MAVKTRKGPTTEKAPKQAVKSAVKKASAPKPAAKKTAAKPAVKKAEPAKKSAVKAADKKPAKQEAKALDPVFLTEYDRYLFGKGRDYKIYQKWVHTRQNWMERKAGTLPYGHRMPKQFPLSATGITGIQKPTT